MIKYFRNPVSAKLLLKPIHFVSFGFGSGLSPFAPGTFGTIAAMPLYYFLHYLSIEFYLLVLLISFIVGIYVCGKTSVALGEHDHGAIVWDEVVGYFISMIAVPFGWWQMIAGFFLFRLFDVFKPWPIYILDKKVSGGFGIMIDDVLAGVYALICMHILLWFGFFQKLDEFGIFNSL